MSTCTKAARRSSAPSRGGGMSRKSEEQPHAPGAITHEPGIPMRGADPNREAMPVGNRNALKHGHYSAKAIAAREP